MYAVVYKSDLDARNLCVIGIVSSLQEAADLRKVSGDLVFDSDTGIICNDESWLFDWERRLPADKPGYARSEIKKGSQVPLDLLKEYLCHGRLPKWKCTIHNGLGTQY